MTASDPGGSATSTIVSTLQVGTQYQVRVAAKTELGVGPNSYGTTQVTTFNGGFIGCNHMCQLFVGNAFEVVSCLNFTYLLCIIII